MKANRIEYSFLSLVVADYSVRTGAAINHKVRDARQSDREARIYDNHTVLDLTCHNIDPDEPLTDVYSFHIYGNRFSATDFGVTLADFHVEDEEGLKKYRKRKGVEIPVYDIPKGLAVLTQFRDERSWWSALWLAPDIVSDMLALLSCGKDVYAAVHIRNDDKTRWIQGFELQTNNPQD
jgi:hypothetical protein